MVCLFGSAIFSLPNHAHDRHSTDKWVISSWNRSVPSDACLLAIVTVVINHWPLRSDRVDKVINQLYQKVISTAVCIMRGILPLNVWGRECDKGVKDRGEKTGNSLLKVEIFRAMLAAWFDVFTLCFVSGIYTKPEDIRSGSCNVKQRKPVNITI